MDKKGVVVFNVCGTRYETRVSVIESKPDTMLAMLLRHHEEGGGEIFIQGDGPMFRWILYYYTSDILVDEKTVGVPKEVWDREIAFYSLFSNKEEEEKEEESKKKRPLGVEIDEDHELASLAKKHLAKTEEILDEQQKQRHAIYKAILEHLIPRLSTKSKDIKTCAEFIGRSSDQKYFVYPPQYPANLRDIDFEDINRHFNEFIEYCDKIGFLLTKESYFHKTTVCSNGYAIFPHDVRTSHQALTIGLQIKNSRN